MNPKVDLQRVRTEYEILDLKRATPLDQVIKQTFFDFKTKALHVDHSMYFGVFNPNPLFPSVIADTICSLLNPQLASSVSAGFAIECELKLIQWLGEKFGFSKHYSKNIEGTFTHGGTEANLMAVVCALKKFTALSGSSSQNSMVIYTSKETHHSFQKILKLLSNPSLELRELACDNFGKLNCEALSNQIFLDKTAGLTPLMVVGTIGTTSAGAIDPIKEISEICQSESIYFHIDAAWGGGAMLLEKFHYLKEYTSKANSITIDCHKWFSVPMTCGVFLSSEEGLLKQTFDVESSHYMPQNTHQSSYPEPYRNSISWSRRFLGIKLFFNLRVLGEEGYKNLITHSFNLAEFFREHIVQSGKYKIVNESLLPIICLSPKHDNTTDTNDSDQVNQIVTNINNSGLAWITQTKLYLETQQPLPCIRIGFPNGTTQQSDVANLVEILNRSHENLSQK